VFTEGVILGEITAQTLVASGVPATHRRELGGTQVLWKALKAGEIDVYPEYTGTLREEILGGRGLEALAAEGVRVSAPLGFDDSYAVGVRADAPVKTISDLVARPELRFGFSNEFMSSADGWPALRAAYGLPQTDVRGLDHTLAYRALADGAIDATDLYTTDAEIQAFHLRALDDDRHHFPAYEAVLVYRADLAPSAGAALSGVAGRIDRSEMIAMNVRAKIDRVAEARVAADWLASHLGVAATVRGEGRAARLLRTTGDHLVLVAVSLLAAILCALPLGIVAARRPPPRPIVLGPARVVPTIPALAPPRVLIPGTGICAPP